MELKVDVKCADGSDNNCYGFVEIEISHPNGRKFTENEIVKINEAIGELNDSDYDDSCSIDLENNETLEIHARTCDYCGSDQTYNSEGENISAL